MCNDGLRQGDNMSPVLLAYCVNDIEERLTEAECN